MLPVLCTLHCSVFYTLHCPVDSVSNIVHCKEQNRAEQYTEQCLEYTVGDIGHILLPIAHFHLQCSARLARLIVLYG